MQNIATIEISVILCIQYLAIMHQDIFVQRFFHYLSLVLYDCIIIFSFCSRCVTFTIIILILQLSVSLSVRDWEVNRSHSNHAKKFSFSASLDLDVTPGSPLATALAAD